MLLPAGLHHAFTHARSRAPHTATREVDASACHATLTDMGYTAEDAALGAQLFGRELPAAVSFLSQLHRLLEMGFDRPAVEAALQKSRDPEDVLQLLLGGASTPSGATSPAPLQSSALPAPPAQPAPPAPQPLPTAQITGLGATETAPGCLFCTWPVTTAGNVGLPCYGVQLKLVPLDGKLDARVKGPNITPGYWNAPELTEKAFDEEGYYCFGDALRLADPDDVSAGFFFDGRTAENFKLDTGTWVSTGALRTGFINHFGPLIKDIAIAGADQPYLSALVFPNFEELHRISGLGSDALPHVLFTHPAVVAEFQEKLRSLAKTATGSSTLIRKIVLMYPPLSLDAGEVTDKGSVNQRKVLQLRANTVEAIYNDTAETISI